MKIVIKKVGESPQVVEVESLELKDMQAIVGGYIECLGVKSDIDMWLNEEGKIMNLPINLFLSQVDRNGMAHIVDDVRGDIFFCSHDDEGETKSLTDEHIEWIKKKLDEDFVFMGDGEIKPVWEY